MSADNSDLSAIATPSGTASEKPRVTCYLRASGPTALRRLAHTPAAVTATISVIASNGERLTFDATPASLSTPEGMVFFDGPADQGLAAATLGPAPFTYEVVLILDGGRHVATAEWPPTSFPTCNPYVALHFEPPLPAMS